MIYAPHILEKLVKIEPEADEVGNSVPGTGNEKWTYVGKCRCDDNGAGRKIGVGGEMVTYSYHIIIDRKMKIPSGTKVRALEQDGSIRGEGKTLNPSKCNYLNYSEVWI